MQRILVVLVLVAVFVSACGGAAGGPVNITKADNGKTFDVAKGSQFNLTLEGNPTTGFLWETKDLNTAVLKQVGDFAYTADNANLVGSPGKLKFTFEGAGAGTAKLTLIYHQPFDPNTAPAETFEVTINVK